MSPERAAYFMRRFKSEEKLLGPNEQAAVDYVLSLLALARVAELERQEPVALANRGLHAFWVKWTEAAAGLYGPGIKLYAAPVAQAQQLHDLDKQCRDDVARALGLRPSQERGFAWSYLLASIKSCVKASEDAAQAQHSVPEEFSFEYRHPNGECHTVTVSREQVINEMPDFLFEALCSKFCNCEPVGETNVVECCCDEYAEEFKLIAAAPGAAEAQALREEVAALRRDKARLDAIEDNCWDVRHGSSSNAHAGDSSIGIEIVGYYQGAPHIRVLGESYTENLRAAIDQAMTAEAYPPERPEYDDHGRPLRALLSEQE